MQKKVCTQIGCKMHEDGKCLEGLPINECPHVSYESETNDENEEEANNESKEVFAAKTPKPIKLFDGNELNYKDLGIITNNIETNLVVIIGESECGKTTLLAELFNAFQKGSFEDLQFAGSLTQRGFETRCFLSTVASNSKSPDTVRTTSKEFNFLHLRLKRDNRFINFLLSDVSGERFRDARNSSVDMKSLELLKVAENLLLIIDGEGLNDNRKKALTVENIKMFIKRAIDEGILDKNTKLKIAISKWDILHNNSQFDFDKDIIAEFNSEFLSCLKDISFIKIASRSKTQDIENGLGLYDLLNDWDKNLGNNSESSMIQYEKNDRYINNYKCL